MSCVPSASVLPLDARAAKSSPVQLDSAPGHEFVTQPLPPVQPGKRSFAIPAGMPLTWLLFALNLLAYGLQMMLGDQLLDRLGLLYGPAVAAGQDWRLFSSGFLHGSLIHLAFNLYLLFILGQQLERSLGSIRFILLYAGSLVGGALAVMAFDWDQPTIGASGAVLGLAGGFAIALLSQGSDPRKSPVFGLVILNLALPLLLPGISFWGHAGGVVAGILMGLILVWIPARYRQSSAGSTYLQGAAAVVALTFAAAWIARLHA